MPAANDLAPGRYLYKKGVRAHKGPERRKYEESKKMQAENNSPPHTSSES